MSDSHTSFREHFSHNEIPGPRLKAATKDTYPLQLNWIETA